MQNPSELTVPRLYSGADGESHWDEIWLPLKAGAGAMITPDLGAESAALRWAPTGVHNDWHTAPRPQLVVTLSGEVEYETGDGTRRRFGPGTVFLAADVSGRGHIARGVGEAPRLSLFVRLSPDLAARLSKAGPAAASPSPESSRP